MTDQAVLLGAVVVVPASLALLVSPLRGRVQTAVGVLGGAATAGAGTAVAVTVGRSGTVHHAMAGWEPPLGIALRADGPSAVFLGLGAVVGLATTLYAAGDPRTRGGPAFWPLWLLTWAGLNAVLVSADLFNAYVALEVLGLAAVGLVTLGGPKAWGPALRYLVVAVLGSLLFLVAVGMVYGATGTLDMALAGERLGVRWGEEGDDPSATRWPLALATIGLSLKTALFPLHAWLPPAHASAPGAVSPILSGLVVKGSFFVLLRMWFEVLGPDAAVATGLGIAGSAAVLWGGVVALRQTNLKRIVAYSTVVQVGYLFLLFPLTAQASDTAVRSAWVGALTMVTAHGIAKAALFMCAGSLLLAYDTDVLDGLTPAAREHPMVVMAMALASVSLAGLPLSLGFAAKWEMLSSALVSGAWVWLAVILVGSLLSVAYLFRPVAATLRDGDPGADGAEGGSGSLRLPAMVRYVPLALGLLSIVAGMAGGLLADLAVVGVLPGGGR